MEPKTKTRIQEILDEWDEPRGYEAVTCSVSDTIDLSSLGALGANVSLTSPYTYTATPNVYSIGSGINTTWTGGNVPWLSSGSGRINLSGEDADIEVNGWSLVDAVKRIEERLGLFQPNPELEQEWAELRALGEQYRKLEQHIRDKQATWDRLKAMPAPDLD